MVLLTLTPAARAAIDEYRSILEQERTEKLSQIEHAATDGHIEHHLLVDISRGLLRKTGKDDNKDSWRLDTLLKGASIYQAPPAPKPEPTSEFKALMQRLREQEERRQYERMIHPPSLPETFNQRFPNAGLSFNPAISHGQTAFDEPDEVTYADVNRQIVLICNVLISIIFSGVTIWFAARRWNVPERLGLSMSGGALVAAAEVAIYMGYIRRIEEAKDKEVKTVEQKKIVETWIFDKSSSTGKQASDDKDLRHRKGKHR